MAKAPVDVYRDWLGIAETNRPLTYYQLLKIPPFEDDPAVIRKAYRDLNAIARRYATGDYMLESQELLNELAKGMLCLTDTVRKLEYDTSLGRKVAAKRTRLSFEDILIRNETVSKEKLKAIKNYADAVGIDLHEAALQQKAASPEMIMLAYAESVGLPFVDLNDIGVDEEFAPQIDPNLARLHSFVPLMADHGTLILASPNLFDLDVAEKLRFEFDMPVRLSLCTTAQINEAIRKYYPKDAVQLVRKKDGTVATSGTETSRKETPGGQKAAAVELSKEGKKKRLQMTLVCLMLTTGLISTALSLTRYGQKLPIIMFALHALLPGLLAGGISWFVFSKEEERDDEEEDE